ncbi:MAG: tRNA (adenine(22)-N(1))-methyltransferase [Bacillota bacterium]
MEAVARYIEEGCAMADIGCDHGRLSVALLQRGTVSRAVAIDRSALSLEKAGRLAVRLHLDHRLDCRVGDGFDPLQYGEVQAVVIAGMGGLEIARILQSGMEKIGHNTRLILQPMQKQDVLRKALVAQGLHILDEDLAAENGRLFDVIAAGRQEAPPYDLRYAGVGFRLWQKRHPLLKTRVAHKLRINRNLLGDLEANGCGTKETLDALKESVRLYEEMLLWL